MHDIAIVGGGPAGLSAALWASRYRRKTVLLDGGRYRNASVERAHGYLGSDPMDPAEFRHRARSQLERYDAFELCETEVLDVARDDGVIRLETFGGASYEAARLVLATGVVDEFPPVENFFEHYGASVFHCPSCDGYEASGREVVVFGWNEQVVGFALHLLDWAASVVVVTGGRQLDADARHRYALRRAGIAVVEDDAMCLEGRRGDLREVTLRREPALRCQLAFFSISHTPTTALAQRLGCARTDDGYLDVDAQRATTTPGVYAAGDVIPGCQMVQVAAADGAIAGSMCAMSLHGEAGAVDSPAPAPAPPD